MRTYERLIVAFNGLWHAFRRDEGLLCLSLLLCVACSRCNMCQGGRMSAYELPLLAAVDRTRVRSLVPSLCVYLCESECVPKCAR